MKPGIFTESVETYLARLAMSPPLPNSELFEEMHGEAFRRNFPIVGPEVGRFFLQLSMMRRPQVVLELGSGFGYSAIWWAMGCSTTTVHLTDNNPGNLALAKEFAVKGRVEDQLRYHEGDALKTAESLASPFSIIFCDIDKKDYPNAVRFANRMQVPGDLLLFDNMLWDGRVGEDPTEDDADTAGVRETTRLLYSDRRWATSLLPIRDGLLVALRVS